MAPMVYFSWYLHSTRLKQLFSDHKIKDWLWNRLNRYSFENDIKTQPLSHFRSKFVGAFDPEPSSSNNDQILEAKD